MGVRINKDILNSKSRSQAVTSIEKMAKDFGVNNHVDVHLSGLPQIRDNIATRIAKEMQWFLAGSVLLSAIILFIFFRSVGTTVLSLAVVLIGVVWSLAIIHLCGYRITILSALIPPLIVVIGVPNCIYFLNKYHTAYLKNGDKRAAIVEMVSKMGIVTLFCNLTAAIGFAVFALTKSAVLKEFGVVAGLSIMVIFFISFILLPASLSFLLSRKSDNKIPGSKWLDALLSRIERWVFNHKSLIYGAATLVVAFAVMGILRLKSEGYIVDDLPKNDPLYTDLKFFEKNFKGVMRLEILVDTKKKYGFVGARALPIFEKVDSLAQYIASKPEMAPLSLAEDSSLHGGHFMTATARLCTTVSMAPSWATI
jgi:predicted RND superfamily exporter protein